MKKKFNKPGLACVLAITLLVLNSSFTNQGNKSANEKAIKNYYGAYEKKDWKMLSAILANGFTFTSPNDDHIDVKTYKKRCWPNCYHVKKFDIDKLMIEGDEAFVTYNGWTTDGKLFRNTEYFTFKDGKILQNVCYFGPGVSFPNNTKK